MSNVDRTQQVTHIKVIGVGFGGVNTVNHMLSCPVQGVGFICADTDARALSRCPEGCALLLLGACGLGAAHPSKGRLMAEMSLELLRKELEGTRILFITAGMGSGTGTGASPVIARVAKEMGILTMALVTKPGDWETGERTRNANAGLVELESHVDSLIVISLDEVSEMLGDDFTQTEFFAQVHGLLKTVVCGLSEAIVVALSTNPQNFSKPV